MRHWKLNLLDVTQTKICIIGLISGTITQNERDSTNRPNILIEKLVPGGQGIGTIKEEGGSEEGKKAFLWNALPGELITDYTITVKKRHYLEGFARKIDNPSEYRIEPKDACFLSTSPWQCFDYQYELGAKRLLVEESLRQAKVALPEAVKVKSVATDNNQWFYRNKMEYSLFWDNENSKILPAFHVRGTHRKAPVESSSLEHAEIFSTAKRIIEELNQKHEQARKYQSLILRSNKDGHVSGGLFENGKPHPVFENLTDEILGRKYSYSPNGFFQINLPVYELALKEIAKEIDTEKVLDLYAGVGTIGLSVARDSILTLVESNSSAFQELKNNCNGTNATPVLAKSEDALDYIAPDLTVILDPPRAGCDKRLVDTLLEKTPEKIIYLSCNPSTQARDVKILTEKYTISRVSPFNFFPHTPHIENLIVLRKKN